MIIMKTNEQNKNIETAEAVLNKNNPVVNPDANCIRDKYTYENHIWTQGIIRRYVVGRLHGLASQLSCEVEKAKEIKEATPVIANKEDLNMLADLQKSGLQAEIVCSGTCIGGCVDIRIKGCVSWNQ